MGNLLFEIGTEEIPAGYLQSALAQMKKGFAEKLDELKLGAGDIYASGTPRRLVLYVDDLQDRQDDITEELIGPSKKAGFDSEGQPTRAAIGFARSKGVEVGDLEVVDTEKGEYLMLRREVPGKQTRELLPEVLSLLIDKLNFPKSMIWGSNKKPFAMPIQWLMAMYDDAVIPFEYNNLASHGKTRGHRFTANEEYAVPSADMKSFRDHLKKLDVILDFDERRECVVQEVSEGVKQNGGQGQVLIDEGLVDTVTNLVEMPFAVRGAFDEKFLELPPEVLITSMREHQKYFPVVDEEGKLLPAFIAVNNTRVKKREITRKGHQRVLRARLEDALFFYMSDQETSLEKRAAHLEGIIFQAKLGTMKEKSVRIGKLAAILVEKINPGLNDVVKRAAELCKSDLLTDMVGEFPSLQGVMGGAYALKDGESAEVATAIAEHYKPLRAGAALPRSEAARIVGLADRIDTIAGCFGIHQVPTGTTDPFGLRRLTLAVIHLVDDSGWEISLHELFLKALALYGDMVDGSAETVRNIMQFVKTRYENEMVTRGCRQQAVEAVTSVEFDNIIVAGMKIRALEELYDDENFGVLAASYKRIRNIIKKNTTTEVNESLFEEEAEKKLYEAFSRVAEQMAPDLETKAFPDALKKMLALKEMLDDFFDKVMVMADDEKIRQNRLNMLTGIGRLVLQIGDISKMQ